tara:strand:+ start:391 stop:972 length:582 start_codon:yes stop_codon:yes gene_type:complete
MDLTSLKYEDTTIIFQRCLRPQDLDGYERGLIYKVLLKEYDYFTDYGVMWRYDSLIMIYKDNVWHLKYYIDTEAVFVDVAVMYESYTLPSGHILPGRVDGETRWTKLKCDNVFGIHILKITSILEEQIERLKTNLFSKITPFSQALFPVLRVDMKIRIGELFMIFHRLRITSGVILPEEMIVQILINLDVVTE